MKPTEITLLAKSWKAILLLLPNWTLSTPQLHLQILSMKITNRMCEKLNLGGAKQPPRTSRISIQLSLCLYKNQMAHSDGLASNITTVAPTRHNSQNLHLCKTQMHRGNTHSLRKTLKQSFPAEGSWVSPHLTSVVRGGIQCPKTLTWDQFANGDPTCWPMNIALRVKGAH